MPNAVVDTLLFLFCAEVSRSAIVMRCICATGTSFSLGSSCGTGIFSVLGSSCTTILLCLLGDVSKPGITKSGVAISHRLSSDTIEEVADLSRLWDESLPSGLSGEGVFAMKASYTELPGDSKKLVSIKTSELSFVCFLSGGFGNGSLGGEPGSFANVVKVRVSVCFLAAFNRCEVDLKIVVN